MCLAKGFSRTWATFFVIPAKREILQNFKYSEKPNFPIPTKYFRKKLLSWENCDILRLYRTYPVLDLRKMFTQFPKPSKFF